MDGWADFHLFPDRREKPVAVITVGGELKKLAPLGADGAPFASTPAHRAGGWYWGTKGIDPQAVITTLQRVEWEHQPLLAYRSPGENGWSYLRIVRRVESLWGDSGEEER